ncbi:MAG TPA: class I SAM-dependent methyltransferase [Candidatus Tectomicrobia bacterium]
MHPSNLKKWTADSFAYEWQRFRVPPQDMADNFWGYFQFFSPEFFRGQRVLEAGSGMGRHTYFLAQFAGEVVAIDLGGAIRVTAANTATQRNVRLVQADIDHLPFQPESFDFICSIGALHHLPDPKAGFHRLVHCLRPGGTLHVYLYWALEDAAAWKRSTLALITTLRRLTVPLPHPLLERLAWLVAVVGYLSFALPYRYLSPWPATDRLVKQFPLQRYAKDGFRVCYNDQFDRLSAPLEHRFTRNHVLELFALEGLVDVHIQPHYGWLACGRKPEKTGK